MSGEQRVKQRGPFASGGMITLLGVGHVFDLGRSVRDTILARRPKVVALELDPVRYHALMSRQPRGRPLSVFSLLAAFQARIAGEYGVRVGDEMVAAARAAQELGSEIALIDENSQEVLLRTWRAMTFQERVRLLASALGSVFVRRQRVEAEIQRFQQDERAYIEQFAKELPGAKRVLIDERDAHMARALRDLHASKGDVVAVVGDGHVEGLLQHLAGEPISVVRLKDLRSAPPSSTASATLSYQL